jgi:hypothetical protein
VQLAGNVATRGGGTSDSMGQWGAVVQGGYFLNSELELFARYEVGSTDTDKFRVAEPGVELESNNIVTVGLNYFIGGNRTSSGRPTSDSRWRRSATSTAPARIGSPMAPRPPETGSRTTASGSSVRRSS